MISFLKKVLKKNWDVFKTAKNSFRTLQQWWDFGKVQIKQFCQQYSQNVTRELTLTFNTLETDILKLQELTHLPGNRSDVESLIKNKKTQLSDLLGVKTQGALVRSHFLSVNVLFVKFLVWKGKMDRTGSFMLYVLNLEHC